MAEASKTVGTFTVSRYKTTMSNAKFEVEKFDGMNNIGMWEFKILDVLTHQELDISLEDRPDDITDKNWVKFNHQACRTIRLCLAKDQSTLLRRRLQPRSYGTNLRTSTRSRVWRTDSI